MSKKSYFERTGKTPPKYMIDRGKILSAANKKCPISNQDKRIACIKRELKK